MVNILSIASSQRSQWFCLCIALALTGCSKGKSEGGGFDGANAPYGPKTPTTQLHSTLTFSPPAGSGLTGITAPQVTAVVGQTTIAGTSYDRLATTRVDDPSKGGEYWIKENSDETLDFAGFRHSSLAGGIVPAASMTFTTPIKVNLDPPIGQAQAVTTSGTLTQGDTHSISSANVTGQYTLLEKGATVATGVGPLTGCNHYSGQAASDSAGIPAAFMGQPMNGELWYHPSYGVVAFNAPAVGIGTVMTDTSDCGSVDSSGYRTIRKVAVVDSSSSFNLDTYDCDGNQFAADANTHAQMLLELRWVDETQAKTDSEPRPSVEFGVASGNYFPNSITASPTSIFHPEENGKGFKYWYSYVSQADKNEQIVSTAYHITVGAVPGLSAVRVTARIYYKVIPSLVGALPDASTGGGKRDSGVDAAASDGPSGVFGTIVLDPIAAGDLANWTPPAVNSNPTMTFEEIVSPYDSGVALRTTATGTTLMACPVEYTSRDFQLPGSVSSAAYALQLYLALDSDMTTYNWPGLQVDLLSGGAVVADIQYYSAAATGTFIMQRTASWHAIANNGFQALPLSPLLDSSGAVIPTPVTFDKIRITMVNYTCIGTNSVIIDQLSLVPTDATGSGGSRDGGVGATGGVDAAGGAGGIKDAATTDADTSCNLISGACGNASVDGGTTAGQADGGTAGDVSARADIATLADAVGCPVAPVGAACTGDLSNIGKGDFTIAFKVTTTQTSETALVNQRTSCNYGMFWDVRMVAQGGVVAEMGETVSTAYVNVSGGGPINDGRPHDILVRRASGVLTLYVDCVNVRSASSTASFTSLAAFASGVDVCDGIDGTVALVGSITNICISRS